MTEEFEKWMSDWCARNPNPATVLQEQTVWAAAWQASRKQAIEECAVKAEYTICECCWHDGEVEAAQEIAFQIRALQQ